MAQAFTEHEKCMRSVYSIAERIVRAPDGSPPEYTIRAEKIPAAFFTARKNIFSTLFYSTYLALDIPESRRLLYGKINHLFRIWVTSADNLLDGEDKCVLPLEMPGNSRVMREVVALMATDRVLWHLLRDAISDGTITEEQANRLADDSLRCLLPSAAQEASEEGGITSRPTPDYVLETIHSLKTGLLFNIPFTGVDLIENQIDRDRLDRIKQSLLLFGNACQILDDVRDMARDFVERRNNYVLSVLAHEQPDVLARWSDRDIKVGDRLYLETPAVSLTAAKLGYKRLAAACATLSDESVILPGAPIARLANSMFLAMDLEDLAIACEFICTCHGIDQGPYPRPRGRRL
ncbi:MAG: hypothetical protein PHU80_02200 [Kiritimatiellae bacterium]|nr:hypothetical protein [Kiritimatiellia bacterium]